MSGRRAHQRLSIGSVSAVVRVTRDVAIDRMDHQELVVISQAAAVIGEEMSLELFGGRGSIALKVRVLASQPVVIGGSLRHRLRVVVMTTGPQDLPSNRESLAASPAKPEIA
jgi:hypothetical protein